MKKYLFPQIGDCNLFLDYNHRDYPEYHSHDYWEIVLITEGPIIHKINGQQILISANTLCLIRPDDCHSFLSYNNNTCATITLGIKQNTFVDFIKLIFPHGLEHLTKENVKQYELPLATTTFFINNANKLQMQERNSPIYQIQISMIFLDLIKEVIFQINRENQIKSNYSQPVNVVIIKMYQKENVSFSTEEILDEINYSHCHIIRLFKKETGLTPSHFFLKIKLNYAKNLLETTNLSILDIAMNVGFSSLGHFTNIFKQHFYISPGQYRKNWNDFYNSFKEM
jgi:AraC family cel operon transcriptional repressor